MTRTSTIFYLYLTLVLILMGVIGGGVWYIKHKTAEAAVALEEANTLARSDSIIQSIRAIKATNQEYLGFFQTLVVDEESIVPFLELVEGTGKSMGLTTTITTVNLEKEKMASSKTAKANAQKLRITLETEGAWGPSIEYLHALENLPTQASIESVILKTDIPQDQTTDTKKVWHLSVSLVVYAFK